MALIEQDDVARLFRGLVAALTERDAHRLTTGFQVAEIYQQLVPYRTHRGPLGFAVSNPFRYEGKKTYAYEIAEAFGGRAPDWILHPAAGSMSVVKTWKGFGELDRIGLVHTTPRLGAVQPENCAPIVAAYRQGNRTVSPVAHRPTIAGGLSMPNPGDLGDLTLQALRESGGAAVAVTENEIVWGMRALWEEGIFAEPTGAVTIPALRRLLKQGTIRREDTVVCIVTGTGFKDLHSLEEQICVPRPVPTTFSALEEATQAVLA